MQSCPLVALLRVVFLKSQQCCRLHLLLRPLQQLLLLLLLLMMMVVPVCKCARHRLQQWSFSAELADVGKCHSVWACFGLSAARWDWTHSLIKWVAGVICLSHSFTHNSTASTSSFFFFSFFIWEPLLFPISESPLPFSSNRSSANVESVLLPRDHLVARYLSHLGHHHHLAALSTHRLLLLLFRCCWALLPLLHFVLCQWQSMWQTVSLE